MSLSIAVPLLLASPWAISLLSLTAELTPLLVRLGSLIVAFRKGPLNPVTTNEFEVGVQALLGEIADEAAGETVACAGWIEHVFEKITGNHEK